MITNTKKQKKTIASVDEINKWLKLLSFGKLEFAYKEKLAGVDDRRSQPKVPEQETS